MASPGDGVAGNAEQAAGCSYLCLSRPSGLEDAAATSRRSESALAEGLSLIFAPSVNTSQSFLFFLPRRCKHGAEGIACHSGLAGFC